MRKIRAYGKENRIPMSLSNYIYSNGNGYDYSKKLFTETINTQPFNGKKICEALNNTKHILHRFTVASQTKDTIILEAADYLGNIDCIKIEKA